MVPETTNSVGDKKKDIAFLTNVIRTFFFDPSTHTKVKNMNTFRKQWFGL
jgi:hypothetical protein